MTSPPTDDIDAPEWGDCDYYRCPEVRSDWTEPEPFIVQSNGQTLHPSCSRELAREDGTLRWSEDDQT